MNNENETAAALERARCEVRFFRDVLEQIATPGPRVRRRKLAQSALGFWASLCGSEETRIAPERIVDAAGRLARGACCAACQRIQNELERDRARLDWLDKRLDYFGRISLRLEGKPDRCIIAEDAPDECGNFHNGDEIGSSAGKLMRAAIDAGMSHNARLTDEPANNKQTPRGN